jgi:hypothetical protein
MVGVDGHLGDSSSSVDELHHRSPVQMDLHARVDSPLQRGVGLVGGGMEARLHAEQDGPRKCVFLTGGKADEQGQNIPESRLLSLGVSGLSRSSPELLQALAAKETSRISASKTLWMAAAGQVQLVARKS